MRKGLTFLPLSALILLGVLGTTSCDKNGKVVRISTTTSVNDSGLMPYLQNQFEKDTGYKWEIASAGTGAAINAAKYGNADVILVHSKSQEETFVTDGFARKVEGYTSERISFMHNFFVLAGPTTDVAGVKTVKADNTKTVKDGFAAIANYGDANSKEVFVSRGDKSGTHTKEVGLWPTSYKDVITSDVTKLTEDIKKWYVSAGQGMGACLSMANTKNAYVLSDKATFLSYKKDKAGDKVPNLEITWEEDSNMKNTYSMIAVKSDAPFTDTNGNKLEAGKVTINTKAADVFVNWMTSETASNLIKEYGKESYGQSLFTLDSGYKA